MLALFVIAGNSWAVDDLPRGLRNGALPQLAAPVQKAAPTTDTRMTGHMDPVLSAIHGQNGPWLAPRVDNSSLDLEAIVWVDDSWTDQTSVDLFDNTLTWGVDAFATIREGIAAVAANGTVNVLPGSYTEATPGCFLFDASGPYQFGLFIPAGKDDVTLQGVDAVGSPITSYGAVAASVGLNATNGFGPSGMFVEANGITVTGLELFQTGPDYNKTVEVIGDDFTLKYCQITDGMSCYINDFRFDSGNDISYVQSYHIEGNLFDYGTSLDIANGAGYTGAVASRQVINNVFDMDWPGNYWAAISFNGSGSGVPWYVYSVGAAVISGNTFSNSEALYIRHRGNFANYGDFDWVGYWNNNTFDKKVMFGTNPPTAQGSYSYMSGPYTYNNVKEIGANIQREIDWAAAGDVVLCGAGTYSEWDLSITKALTLQGAGVTSVIDASGYVPIDDSHAVVTINLPSGNVTVDGFKIKTGRMNGMWASGNSNPASLIKISNNELEGFSYYTDPTPASNFGLIAGYGMQAKVEFSNNDAHDFYSNVLLFERQLGETEVKYNTFTSSWLAFYMTYSANHVTTLQKVHHNTFDRCEIYVNSATNYGPAIRSGKYTNFEISDNVFTNVEDGARAIGMGNDADVTPADGEIVTPRILHNTIIGSGGGTNFRGIQLLGYVTNARIENNYITGVAEGIRVWQFYTPGVFPVNTKIYGNSITNCGVKAVRWDGPGILNASGNWWGSDAPAFGSIFTGSVDYSPWMGLVGTHDNPGYTGNFSNLWVDDDSPISGASNYIMEALALVSGSTINLAPGTYIGQVHAIGYTNLNIIGSGVGSSIIKAPAGTMPDTYLTSGNPNRPVLFLDNSTVHVSNLTVDGDGRGGGNHRLIGVAFWNSGGTMTNVNIIGVRDNPLINSARGVGVSVNHSSTPDTVTLTDVTISDFQRLGVSVSGLGTHVNCTNVDVTGVGPTGIIAQTGFQYATGTSGTLLNCTVDGVVFTAAGSSAAGIFLFTDGVTLTNSNVLNGHVCVFADDAGFTMNGGTLTATNAVTVEAKHGVLAWSTGGALLGSDFALPQLYEDEVDADSYDRARSLDVDESISISGATIIGNGSTGYGVRANVTGDNLDVSLTNSVVEDWNYGVFLQTSGGTIDNATVTDNSFANTNNAFDNTAAHTWDSNCYSDYTSNAGYPGTYVITGAAPVNVDSNPNPNGCADVNFVLSDDLVGCNTDCNTTNLYLTLGTAGLPNLQVILQLPAGFTAGPLGIVTPGANEDPNLISAYAMATGDCVIVDMGFETPYSSGDYTKYVACIPLTVTAPTGVYPITGVSSLWIDIMGGNHVNELELGVVAIEVDCTPPVISNFANSATCAFGDASQLINAFSATFTDNAVDLDSAWVTFAPGGGSFGLFGPTQSSGYAPTFPSAADAATFYGLLVEGCNTLTLHLMDTECNVATTVDLENVGRDNTAPSPVVAPDTTGCYGANTYLDLDNELDISYLGNATPCGAVVPSVMSIWLVGGTDTLNVADPFDNANWPFDDADATTLWNWIVGSSGVPNSANGEYYSFGVRVCDCAGNCDASGSFTMCIDLTAPGNTVTFFDARPTHLGVWLAWSWTAGSDAQEMRIYRSPLSGEYPAYANDLWNTLSNYDVTSVPPSGWTLVATQTAPTGTVTSATYGANNNRGDFYTHVDGPTTYWLDAQGTWVDGNGNAAAYRDIYRYVTFVKDAGGNWSLNAPVAMLQNADRSTNYWLGDFSTADDVGDPYSRGRVDNDDLASLSAVYFTNAGGFRNIGPVNTPVENGNIGKGIPNPDDGGLINFQDLVPFSFNYAEVTPVGEAKEFMIQPDPLQYRPFNRLDEAPVVALEIPADAAMEVGSEFTVTVALYGNEANTVKAVEAILSYDETTLEIVTSTTGTALSPDGMLFAKTSPVTGLSGVVGFVAASCGGWSTLEGNAILGTVTFRVTRALTANSELALTSVSMFDNTGEIIEVEGGTVPLFSTPSLPDNYALYQNYPNPFNPTTNLRFDLRDAGHVKIMVYNTLGQVVATAVDRELEAGRHTVTFDASSLSTGVYMYTISVNGFTDVKKMLLIR
ncbi:T9SS type A sorting domain-containing protein [bacterium]|nr:T9SS type A sorting domain-containing protein [bacterium]